jgi:glycerol uptake facilitator-like aquaporin
MEKTEDPILPYTAPTIPSSFPTRVEERPNRTRSELTIFAGEFIGTFMFLFLAFAGTQIATKSATINLNAGQDLNRVQEVSMLLYISFAFGAALAVNVCIFADVSGAMFNPAVSVHIVLPTTHNSGITVARKVTCEVAREVTPSQMSLSSHLPM